MGKLFRARSCLQGSGWDVIKVIWGSEWDPLFAIDHNDVMQRRMDEVLDMSIRCTQSQVVLTKGLIG